MLSLIPYMVKVVIISGILFGYYRLFLRDKKFHRFNRFYLLSAIAIPLWLPLIHFDLSFAGANVMLPEVLRQDIRMDDIIIIAPTSRFLNFEMVLNGIYLLVAFILCVLLIYSIIQIYRISVRGHTIRTHGTLLISTPVPGTPFSFFNRVFWNPETNLQSAEGVKLLNHELAHCRQRHSADKIFTSVACALFWFNPLFWFIKKELHLVHEFLADEESFQSDGAAFSKIILQGIYPGYRWDITNNFYYSPIKRRIMMLFKNNQRKANYLGRILILPLAAGIFLFFTMKDKTNSGITDIQPVITDTIPQSEIQSVDVKPMVVVTTKDGRKETMTIEEAQKAGIILPKHRPIPKDLDKVFTKAEKSASFPGGLDAWERYVTKVFEEHFKEFGTGDYGTCVVRFIVDKSGNVRNVEATNMKGTHLAEVAIDAIRKGPKWIPAQQNGHYVNAYRLQPISLSEPD